MFDHIVAPRPDSLMEIGQLHRNDPRDDKIDLGLGTYRDNQGLVPVLTAVKHAEQLLIEDQVSKGYKGPSGDARFCTLLRDELWPNLAGSRDGRLTCLQAAGGTGALRLGLELAGQSAPNASILVGTPTWPNHLPLTNAVGLRTITYRHYDPATGKADFQALIDALDLTRPGDMVLLHGCCHNPTGAGFSDREWQDLGGMIAVRGLVPVIDLAYAGMAKGLAMDVIATRAMLEALPEAIVAVSCSKSFGLYCERTGMLAVLAPNTAQANACRLTAETIARLIWSNPPDHGAAIVRTILSDAQLRKEWLDELQHMRLRLDGIRSRLACQNLPGMTALAAQEGLFALLPLVPDRITDLRVRHAIYIEGSGRINIAGLNDSNINRFLEALADTPVGRSSRVAK